VSLLFPMAFMMQQLADFFFFFNALHLTTNFPWSFKLCWNDHLLEYH